MSGPNVRVTLQLGRVPDGRDRTFVLSLDEYLVMGYPKEPS